MQKTVKKVSEPVFSNVEFFFYHFRVPGKEELSNFSTYESYLNVKRLDWKLVLVGKIEIWIISVLWVNNQKYKEIIKTAYFEEDILFSE